MYKNLKVEINKMKNKKFITVGEIDATGVRGPHKKELKDLSKNKALLFKNLDVNIIKRIVVEVLGGKFKEREFNADWTINIVFFQK